VKGRFAVQLRRYGRYAVILLALIVVGTATGFYILLQQRLPNPFQSFYHVDAAFPSAAAVVPGLGEPVNVAGVHVGQIVGTSLKGGQAIVHMEIDPGKIPRVYRDARASLVPNTPLMDMQVDIAPGTRTAGVLPHGATIPAAQTTSPINSDELLSALDADTRTWLTSLITDLNGGVSGRGNDIRALLTTVGPTAAQLRQVADLLAARRREIASLVHNLAILTKATSEKDRQLATVVTAGNQTIGALASQDTALQQSIDRLPSTLATTRSTLFDLTAFSNVLGPTATALTAPARRLDATFRNTQTLFQGAVLLPLSQIPPFENAVAPLTEELPPLQKGLDQTVPALTSSFKVLTYVSNEFAYNPGGKNPGFLYWLAWFAHNSNSFISSSDANGPAWRSMLLTTCPDFKSFSFSALLTSLIGTTFGCS
jgi:phospholipid/cholesterol/gamma-HCH transport system substrate-binding protein